MQIQSHINAVFNSYRLKSFRRCNAFLPEDFPNAKQDTKRMKRKWHEYPSKLPLIMIMTSLQCIEYNITAQGVNYAYITAASVSLFHPPLSLVFFVQSSSSPAFPTSLLTTQSFHLSLVLPRVLLSSRNCAALFGSL